MAYFLPSLTGKWTFAGFPDTVSMLGRTFHKAVWEHDYDDVVCQYREASPRRSFHLFVKKDGTWEINHVDAFNPDTGVLSLLAHLISDVL